MKSVSWKKYSILKGILSFKCTSYEKQKKISIQMCISCARLNLTVLTMKKSRNDRITTSKRQRNDRETTVKRSRNDFSILGVIKAAVLGVILPKAYLR